MYRSILEQRAYLNKKSVRDGNKHCVHIGMAKGTYPPTSGPTTGPIKGDIVYTAMGLSGPISACAPSGNMGHSRCDIRVVKQITNATSRHAQECSPTQPSDEPEDQEGSCGALVNIRARATLGKWTYQCLEGTPLAM